MPEHFHPVGGTPRRCHVCMHDIPPDEVVVPEAIDFIGYFWGMECFERWWEIAERANDRRPKTDDAPVGFLLGGRANREHPNTRTVQGVSGAD